MKHKQSAIKKNIFIILCVLIAQLLCASLTVYSYDSEVTIVVNGEKLNLDGGSPQVIGDGTTMVPFRAIFEALGLTVDYNVLSNGGVSVWATSSKRDVAIALTTVNKNLYKCTYSEYGGNASNIEKYMLPEEMREAPFVDDTDRTLIPIRAVSEALGAIVEWDEDTQTVWIYDAETSDISLMNISQNTLTLEECIEKYKTRKCFAMDLPIVVGLHTNGTVSYLCDDDDYDLSSIDDWRNIVSVDCGYGFVVGLKSDGTVVAAGDNTYGQCDVDGWTDIVSIAAGTQHVLGLKSDGTVVAAGRNGNGRCDVNIGDYYKACGIWAGSTYSVLKLYMYSSTGDIINEPYEYIYGTENGAVDYSLSQEAFLAIQSDGSVLLGESSTASKVYDFNSQDALKWTNKKKVLCTYSLIASLDYSGRVETLNEIDPSSWKNIADICGEDDVLVCICDDGTIELGYDDDAGVYLVEYIEECEDWTNIGFPE